MTSKPFAALSDDMIQNIISFVDFPFWTHKATLKNVFGNRTKNVNFKIFNLLPMDVQLHFYEYEMKGYNDKPTIPVPKQCRIMKLHESDSRHDIPESDLMALMKQAPLLQKVYGTLVFENDIAKRLSVVPKTMCELDLTMIKNMEQLDALWKYAPNVQKLQISFYFAQNTTMNIGNYFAKFPYLKELHLSMPMGWDCKLEIKWDMPTVEKLYLRQCKDMNLQGIENLTNVKSLWIRDAVDMFPYHQMKNITHLRVTTMNLYDDIVGNIATSMPQLKLFEMGINYKYCTIPDAFGPSTKVDMRGDENAFKTW